MAKNISKNTPGVTPVKEYAYYPGCTSQEITKEADFSTRKIAEVLGIGLNNMPKASCCGAGLLMDQDYELYMTVNCRILAEAEEMGMDILTICSTCLMVISTVNRDFKMDPVIREKVNKNLRESGCSEYSGNVKVKHLLWVLIDDIGLTEVKKLVKKPLDWLKIAPFYGCHSLRPSSALGFDDADNPSSLENVIETLGGNVVTYEGRTKCCGFQGDLVNVDLAVEMTGTRLLDAKDNGADCIVTPCPFCHINLDNYQGMAEKKVEREIQVPIFHLAQLVGLSFGFSTEEMGLSRHLVSPEKLFA